MTMETKLVEKELNDLIRAHNRAIEFFADLSNSGIVSMTPGVAEKIIKVRKLVEEAQQEFADYQRFMEVMK